MHPLAHYKELSVSEVMPDGTIPRVSYPHLCSTDINNAPLSVLVNIAMMLKHVTRSDLVRDEWVFG